MTPPLRVHPDVAAAYRTIVGARAGRTLMLGVTRELAEVLDDLVALDRSPARVASVWPGDTPGRRAMAGDWFALPFRDRCFGTAIGDGALNIFEFPRSQVRILGELARVLRPAAVVAMRVYCRPERAESVASVIADARAGRLAYFQAFKLRLAMALVARGPGTNISVTRIRDAFDAECPDRERLSREAGWPVEDIATIDLYEHSPDVYCFPTERELAAAIPAGFGPVGFHAIGTYALAERCPILVAERQP